MASATRRRRRTYWVAGIIGFLVTSALVALAFSATPVSYRAERELLFLVPPTVSPPELVNPFLSFSPSVDTAMSVIMVTLVDDRTVISLAPPGSGTDFEVEPAGTSAPVMLVKAYGPDDAVAESLADKVIVRAAENLERLQEESGAPKKTWISTSLISASAEPQREWKDTLRWAIVALAVGGALTGLVLAVAIRRDRRHVGSPDEADG